MSVYATESAHKIPPLVAKKVEKSSTIPKADLTQEEEKAINSQEIKKSASKLFVNIDDPAVNPDRSLVQTYPSDALKANRYSQFENNNSISKNVKPEMSSLQAKNVMNMIRNSPFKSDFNRVGDFHFLQKNNKENQSSLNIRDNKNNYIYNFQNLLIEDKNAKKNSFNTKKSIRNRQDNDDMYKANIANQISVLNKNNSIFYSDITKGIVFGIKIEDFANFKFNKTLAQQLSLIKDALKNEYSEYLVNLTSKFMPFIEQPERHISERGRSIYPTLKKHVSQMLSLNFLLDPFDINTTKDGEIKVLIGGKKNKMSASANTEVMLKNQNYNRLSSPQERLRFMSKSSTIDNIKNTIKKNQNKDKFYSKILEKKVSENQNQNQKNTYRFKSFAKESLKQISESDIYNSLKQDPASAELLSHKDTKVLYPKEIHSKYKIDKKVKKQITVDANSKS